MVKERNWQNCVIYFEKDILPVVNQFSWSEPEPAALTSARSLDASSHSVFV